MTLLLCTNYRFIPTHSDCINLFVIIATVLPVYAILLKLMLLNAYGTHYTAAFLFIWSARLQTVLERCGG